MLPFSPYLSSFFRSFRVRGPGSCVSACDCEESTWKWNQTGKGKFGKTDALDGNDNFYSKAILQVLASTDIQHS